MMIRSIKKIVTNRIFLHILFWFISFYILLHHFSISSEIGLIDYIFTVLFHVSIVTVAYVNLYVLIPRFLNKKDYPLYIGTLILLYLVYYLLHVFTFDVMSPLLFEGYYLITFYDHIELLKYFVIYIGITTLFMLSKYWFEYMESKQRLADAEKEKIQNELKALKAQVNPHFLFNSLNSIYSLALKKSEKTPDVILMLSDVLRYMIYEANEKSVNLTKEIGFIKNYIELQKLRTNVAEPVKLEIRGDTSRYMIAPLIFIVFIENAFKHGLKGDVKDQFIKIIFEIRDDLLEFYCVNNSGIAEDPGKNQYGGLGLENVKRRLEIVYPDRHTLDVKKDKARYEVKLQIQL